MHDDRGQRPRLQPTTPEAPLLALEPDQSRVPSLIAAVRNAFPKIGPAPTLPVAPEGSAA